MPQASSEVLEHVTKLMEEKLPEDWRSKYLHADLQSFCEDYLENNGCEITREFEILVSESIVNNLDISMCIFYLLQEWDYGLSILPEVKNIKII